MFGTPTNCDGWREPYKEKTIIVLDSAICANDLVSVATLLIGNFDWKLQFPLYCDYSNLTYIII